MANRSNQHFVPQFYFRRFSEDCKSINVLLRRDGKVIERAPIKGQSAGHRFYGDEHVETGLSEADGEASAAIRALDTAVEAKARIPDMPEYPTLLIHILLQNARTSTARSRNRAMGDRLLQLELEIAISNDSDLSEAERDELLKILPAIRSRPQPMQLLAMRASVEAVPHILDLKPRVLVNRTRRPFVFSDSPVILMNLLYQRVKIRGVLGFKNPGLIILFPLDEEKMLILFDGGAYTFKGKGPIKHLRDHRDIAALNRLQVHNALNAIYFGDSKVRDYVHSLWSEERTRLSKHEGKVIEAPGIDSDTGEAMGDILHSYQPQLNYLPDFSFFDRYTQIEEKDYWYRER